MSLAYLDPVTQPVVLFEQFIATQPQIIALKEKIFSFSGDSFDIKLESGVPLLKVNGKFFTISGRKRVEDLNGNYLYDLRKEHMHIHTTYVMEEAEKNKICEVKNSHRIIGSKATVTFTDINAQPITLKMEGNWFDHKADIVNEANGEVVARITRKIFNPRHMIFGQDSYRVIVAPGVDMALIAGLCICFDEKNND